MGLKPTQYRCASEALLRRYRKEHSLPSLHPLIDLCNAASVAFAVPIAVFGRSQISGDLMVRQANGTEKYASFSGETEHPEPDEIIFGDDAGNAHARRWANRQSKLSAVSSKSSSVLIVTEALHATAAQDMDRLVEQLGAALQDAYDARPISNVLLSPDAVFDLTKEA